jgi:hypothetical protein
MGVYVEEERLSPQATVGDLEAILADVQRAQALTGPPLPHPGERAGEPGEPLRSPPLLRQPHQPSGHPAGAEGTSQKVSLAAVAGCGRRLLVRQSPAGEPHRPSHQQLPHGPPGKRAA